MRASLERRGIDVCDLTPPLRERAKSGPQLYLRVGAHWTDAGNEAAADAIAACLGRLAPNASPARSATYTQRTPLS
jgi:alginate O-acetyltransferase complex protein AlgJ